MKTLTIDMWESDNVEFDIDISNELAAAIAEKFKEWCEEGGDDYEECLDDEYAWSAFFDDFDLASVSQEDAGRIDDIVWQEVLRSIRENWDDPSDSEGWKKYAENCRWGYHLLRLDLSGGK